MKSLIELQKVAKSFVEKYAQEVQQGDNDFVKWMDANFNKNQRNAVANEIANANENLDLVSLNVDAMATPGGVVFVTQVVPQGLKGAADSALSKIKANLDSKIKLTAIKAGKYNGLITVK